MVIDGNIVKIYPEHYFDGNSILEQDDIYFRKHLEDLIVTDEDKDIDHDYVIISERRLRDDHYDVEAIKIVKLNKKKLYNGNTFLHQLYFLLNAE